MPRLYYNLATVLKKIQTINQKYLKFSIILQKKVNVDSLKDDETFNKVNQKMGITFNDKVVISPDTFKDNYKEKVNFSNQFTLHFFT